MLKLLYDGKVPFILIGKIWENNPIIYPGSFNPIHDGHIKAAQFIFDEQRHKKQIYLELSIGNCDKPDTTIEDMQSRIDDILRYRNEVWFGGLLVDNVPYFVDKDILYDNPDYIVGTDTFNRIHPLVKPYSFFHVLPRPGYTYIRNDMLLSDYYEEYFGLDISSTNIREQYKNGSS